MCSTKSLHLSKSLRCRRPLIHWWGFQEGSLKRVLSWQLTCHCSSSFLSAMWLQRQLYKLPCGHEGKDHTLWRSAELEAPWVPDDMVASLLLSQTGHCSIFCWEKSKSFLDLPRVSNKVQPGLRQSLFLIPEGCSCHFLCRTIVLGLTSWALKYQHIVLNSSWQPTVSWSSSLHQHQIILCFPWGNRRSANSAMTPISVVPGHRPMSNRPCHPSSPTLSSPQFWASSSGHSDCFRSLHHHTYSIVW